MRSRCSGFPAPRFTPQARGAGSRDRLCLLLVANRAWGGPSASPSFTERSAPVALSSTRVWILLASVVALGIVLVGAVAFASPKKDAVNHENGKGSTLTVVIKSREAAVVDVGERGLSHGDARVVNAPLYDEDGSMAECFLTYTLPGGEIDTQSVTAFPRLPAPPPKAIDAITGGTKKYEGARGEAGAKTRGKRTFITFHFIDQPRGP